MSSKHFGLLWHLGCLKGSWGCPAEGFGSALGIFEGVLRRLGRVLGRSWGVLGASWGSLGRLGSVLGASWAPNPKKSEGNPFLEAVWGSVLEGS